MVVGLASEAGIWRGGNKFALYRQTWVSGGHPAAATRPLLLTVRTQFDDDGSIHIRSFSVPPGGRWALNLDELRPMAAQVTANALITITADQRTAATVALWHQPIALGVSPTVYPVSFISVETP
jgi:hypothetical protein